MTSESQTAVLGGGCFWCTEAVFERLKGVVSVKSGYAGGKTKNPTYEEISSGLSGHAEVIEIKFEPHMVSYETLLDVFFSMHDPTTLNAQGADLGPQYRSIILYTSDDQKQKAQKYVQRLTDDKTFSKPIVTEIVPLVKFYEAEAKHSNYYTNNPNKPYCQVVINPKIIKLRKNFAHLLNDHI